MVENHVPYICKYQCTKHLAPVFFSALAGINAVGFPVQLLFRTIWSASKRLRMGTWTKAAFLDGEGVPNPTEVKCF